MAGKNPFPQPEPDPADEPPFEPDEAQQPDPRDYGVPDAYPTGKVNLSIKLSPGNEAPWFTFEADTLEGVADLVGYERAGESGAALLIGLIEYASQTERYALDTYRKSVPDTLKPGQNKFEKSGGSGGGRPGKPAEAAQAPAWMGAPPSCDHGPRKYVTKTKANGDRWHAWGCSGEQGSNCSPGLIFANAPKGS